MGTFASRLYHESSLFAVVKSELALTLSILWRARRVVAFELVGEAVAVVVVGGLSGARSGGAARFVAEDVVLATLGVA